MSKKKISFLFLENHWREILLSGMFGFASYLIFSSAVVPGCDFPQHLAQATLWKFLDHNQFGAPEKYYINWFTPYFGGYFLLRVLVEYLQGMTAIKFLLCVNLLLFILSLRRLLDVCNASRDFLFLAVPLFFNFVFYWGFLNYLTALPVSFFLLGLYVDVLKKRAEPKPILFFLLSLILFYCHAIPLAVTVFIAFNMTVFSSFRVREKVLTFLPLLSGPVLLFVWVIWTKNHEPAASYRWIWGVGFSRIATFLYSGPMNGDILYSVSLGFLTLSMVVFILSKRGFKELSTESLVLFGSSLFLYAFVPSYAFGTAFLFERLWIFVMVGLGLCIAKKTEKNSWYVTTTHLSAITGLLLLLNVTLIFHGFDKESKGFLDVTSMIENEKTLCNGTENRTSTYISATMYDQMAAYVQSERGGEVDTSFASHHPELIRYKQWRRHAPLPIKECDYVFAKGKLDNRSKNEMTRTRFELARTVDQWQLYRKVQ